MQQSNQAWIAMISRVPENLHNTLILTMRTGIELVIQKLLKMEPDFLVIRGRISGTQDLARIIMVPYAELSFVSSTQQMKDPEVEAIFGKGAVSALEMSPAPQLVTSEETPAPEESASEGADAPKRPEPVSKTALLAKLRDRMKENK